ncbi:MAG: DUF1259 domain-containing protein [Armatimonadota bacterium]
MPERNLNRRRFFQNAALAAGTGALTLTSDAVSAAARNEAKTPALTAAEMSAIDAALGKKGAYNEAQATYSVPLPRNDLKMTVKGEPVPIPFGFGGWVAVKKTLDGKAAVLMSDTVLLQEEVNPLMAAAHASGLEVSAVHNHFFFEEPRIFYMHVHGMGSVPDVIAKYAAAIKATKLFPANQPPAGPPPARTGKEIFDLPALDAIVKYSGVVNGPTYKYTVGRADLRVLAMGADITAAIGLNSWASFAGTSEAAHICGDIAMLESELNPVIKVLHDHKIDVVAVHNHMIGETPRMMFLHYFGSGPAPTLATGFRAALDVLGTTSPSKPGGMSMHG